MIPEELGAKLTAIPDPKPDTPKEVRSYQLKVRRATRLLYKAGELDRATIKKLEAAIHMPIVALDPLKALKADVTYYTQAFTACGWPVEARKEWFAMLAMHGIINEVKTRRGETTPLQAPDGEPPD